MRSPVTSLATAAVAVALAFGSGFGCGGPDKPPESGSWKPMAAGPALLPPACVVWTGKEMLVWGVPPPGYCTSPPAGKTNCEGGARYNPSTDKWTVMGPAPIDGRLFGTPDRPFVG